MAGRSWRPAYPEALKQVAGLDLCSGEESAQQVADRIGVCRPTLYAWRNELLGHEAASSMKRRKTSAPAPEREELERQLEALQRDVRQLQLEHDLLKKANELLKNTHGQFARLCAVETDCARLLIRGELPMSYWRHLTPLKNVAHGLLRT